MSSRQRSARRLRRGHGARCGEQGVTSSLLPAAR